MGHRHPHVGGALLGVHRLVEIAEQVDRVLGVGPGVKGLSPEVVIFVLRDVILVGHYQRPVEMPQVVHGGGLAPVLSKIIRTIRLFEWLGQNSGIQYPQLKFGQGSPIS